MSSPSAHNFEASTSAFLLGQTTAQQNSKYKAYASAVDKALKSFESTTEWADLIAALGKLGKVFSSNAKTFNDIPNSLTVSKRLSQCLHPALPSGVHLKALDTYRQIFLILGRTQNLARYLFLYAAGLFPLMDHCGIKVKSELLSIFEQFLLPLGPDLRSALPGLVTALLLALEEGTEFYMRAFKLLDELMEKVGSDAFYICFWQAVSGNPSARLPALIFVNAKIEKYNKSAAGGGGTNGTASNSSECLVIISGGGQAQVHMQRALCAAAEDTGCSALVQRHLLDFLCTALPLDSEWICRSDLVQLLRRCLFVLLRRDMSLNRRLYQWLLNRSNDMAFVGLPVNGVEDSLDLAFFKKHALPLIKAAICDYLHADSAEMPVPTSNSAMRGSVRGDTLIRNAQIQFPEVRVCRMLHYMLDRPELGQLVLRESLADLLETFCTREPALVRELQAECEQIDPTFGALGDLLLLPVPTPSKTESKEKDREMSSAKRADEVRKNFNALLNSVEPNFLWTYFEALFTRLKSQQEPDDEPEEEVEVVNFGLQDGEDEGQGQQQPSGDKRVRELFPLMVLYAVKNVQLEDTSGDIRGRHLPNLLRHIFCEIELDNNMENAGFSHDNIIATVIVCRHLLAEITQNNVVSVVLESIQQQQPGSNSVENSPSKKGVKCNKELAEEQRLVESALAACLQLLATACAWYTQGRERDKMGVLTAVATLVRDFADFPFFSLQALTSNSSNRSLMSNNEHPQSPCRSLTDSIRLQQQQEREDASAAASHHQPPTPSWLQAIAAVIEPQSWRTSGAAFDDFDMRIRLLDLLLYLCHRSASMIEQHAAVFGRTQMMMMNQQQQRSTTATNLIESPAGSNSNNISNNKKTTTTVLLKPFLSQCDLDQIERDTLFKNSAAVLWHRFTESTDLQRLQTVAMLLLRLHSRRTAESSSELEELIVSELTSSNKAVSGEAARKFRDLWVFSRSAQIEEVYSGIPLKQMNRVIMVLLGFITDDSLSVEQVELKALAQAWLEDCSRNNGLHRVLQMLTLMLLNPSTARVSIQFVQMRQRIGQEHLASLPEQANCVSLTTVSGKQTFHHICLDVDSPGRKAVEQHQQQHGRISSASSWTDYSYINCDPRQPWVTELNRQLLLPASSAEGSALSFQQQQQQFQQQQNQQQQIPGSLTTSAATATEAAAKASLPALQECGAIGGTGPSSATLRKTHNRTLSDIPQFDNDAESVDSFSLDASLDQEVLDTLQCIVDTVCYDELAAAAAGGGGGKKEVEDEEEEGNDDAAENDANDDEDDVGIADEEAKKKKERRRMMMAMNTSKESSGSRGVEELFGKGGNSFDPRDRCVSAAMEADEVSVVGSLVNSASATVMPKLNTYGSGETIRRIRTGHRRQDSLQESIFSTSTQELRLFDPTELPNSTCPGDHKQPLLDETFSHMLFYAESPSMVDLGRAEKLFRTVGALLKSDGAGRQIVACMLFTNMHSLANAAGGGGAGERQGSISPSASIVSQQLVESMARHYRHIQGEGFWDMPAEQDRRDNGGTNNGEPTEGKTPQQRQSTLFEIFSTVILYFFRSYYLNSPTNYVSEEDLVLAWKCKIAALDCFTELLRILDGIVKEVGSKEFATFVQHVYRQTKAQKVVLTLMLAAVPTPPNQKGWKMPLTMDIAEFNNGPRMSSHFRDLIYAYHRSLLNLASSIVILEHSLLAGMRHFSSQTAYGMPPMLPPGAYGGGVGGGGSPAQQITENQINYNSSQNRSTIREARYSVVELRLFLGVILNALKRCPERHQLWLNFLCGILPYLDRALATFVVHVVEQICRNLYECLFIHNPATNSIDAVNDVDGEPITWRSSPSTPSAQPTPLMSAHISALLEQQQQLHHSTSKSGPMMMQFVDYRLAPGRNNVNNGNNIGRLTEPAVKYPANYVLILMESLMSILHSSMLDGGGQQQSSLVFVSPQLLSRGMAVFNNASSSSSSPQHQQRVSSSVATGGGTFSSSNMSSMVGSAISVIPGTGLINNLFGKVFTSADSTVSSASARADAAGNKTPEWLEAQRELVRRLPSVLAILADIWWYICSWDGGTVDQQQEFMGKTMTTMTTTSISSGFDSHKPLSALILNTLNPIAKKHKNVLINSLAIVWMTRHSATAAGNNIFVTKTTGDHGQTNFVYCRQQVCIARLALGLKSLSLNSIIVAISESLREAANKSAKAPVGGDKIGHFCAEVALLEMLQECTRQVSVSELRDAWSALVILFNESPLGQLPAKAVFLEFIILVDFVRRCGAELLLEDRQISKSILDICQKLVEAVNSIVAWQLESTTWLKRTLVVRQDATSQKPASMMSSSDLSPILDQKSSAASAAAALSASALPSEASSMRGSTISLSTTAVPPPAPGQMQMSVPAPPPSRLSSAMDSHQQMSLGGVGGGGGTDMKKSASSLRSSLKDSSSGGGGHYGAGSTAAGAGAANKRNPTDSTQALAILAENLTELVDSITRGDEKEKLLPTLQAVWNNTLPYLKSKSAKNVRSFLASSQLLASMSSFNYMRPVWKKNALELLWDNSFFKMDIQALRQWLVVVDNLMTNDKSSFKELLARIATSTSTTLTTLITSKEQEWEMRSQYLKRLAFVILSSELDQYSGQLNEIQERLTENLRLCQTPIIHTQVFTCYRVLLVRMSPSSFVSIWPSMITELLQVLAQIEQHLCTANTSALDEQRSVKDEQWMQLFLAGGKLLETLCILPAGYVAQFQMCRWAFVSPMNIRSLSEVFVPFAVRLNRLLNIKYGELTQEDLELRTRSLFSVKTLTSLQELHPLFNALALQNDQLVTNGHAAALLQNGRIGANLDDLLLGKERSSQSNDPLNGSLALQTAVARIEHSLYVDFAEHWQL